MHVRGAVSELTIKDIVGYKILSAKDAATGKAVPLTKTESGYAIKVPAAGEDNQIPVIDVKLDKSFEFKEWIGL